MLALSKEWLITNKKVILRTCKVVPGLWTPLFSITAALKRGCSLGNEGTNRTILKGGFKLSFDKTIKTKDGFLKGVNLKPIQNKENEILQLAVDRDKQLSGHFKTGTRLQINDLHRLLNHPSEAATRKTAKYYGWILNGTFDKCEHCWKAKAEQKNLNKVQVPRTTVLGERLMIDISSIKAKSYVSSKCWLLIMDGCSDEAWSQFLRKRAKQQNKLLLSSKTRRKKKGKR
jgi:hypothetical protein